MTNDICLGTRRLLLRPWREDDREPFAALNADRDVMQYFPETLSRDQSDAMVDRILAGFAARGWGLWAVQVRDDDLSSVSNDLVETESIHHSFIGFVGLSVPKFESHFTPCVEVGWRLARQHWGRGYATEAGMAVCQFAFETLKLSEIVSFTSKCNERSIMVMQRLGMTYHPADEFDHPNLPVGHRLCRHVLYRLRSNNGA